MVFKRVGKYKSAYISRLLATTLRALTATTAGTSRLYFQIPSPHSAHTLPLKLEQLVSQLLQLANYLCPIHFPKRVHGVFVAQPQ